MRNLLPLYAVRIEDDPNQKLHSASQCCYTQTNSLRYILHLKNLDKSSGERIKQSYSSLKTKRREMRVTMLFISTLSKLTSQEQKTQPQITYPV